MRDSIKGIKFLSIQFPNQRFLSHVEMTDHPSRTRYGMTNSDHHAHGYTRCQAHLTAQISTKSSDTKN